MVLRRVAVNDIYWRSRDGGCYFDGCHVPALATYIQAWSVVPQHGSTRAPRAILRYCHCTTNILYHHCYSCVSWYLDFSEIICRRWICTCFFPPLFYLNLNIVHCNSFSFIGRVFYSIMGMGYSKKEIEKVEEVERG